MQVIMALDDNSGLMFNKRRQSQDRVLREHIANLLNGHKLYMNEYSYKMFADVDMNIVVDENFLTLAKEEDYCFVENSEILSHLDKVNSFYIYKWNRVYPADQKFDVDLAAKGWSMSVIAEFAGSSHEKITLEEWRHA